MSFLDLDEWLFELAQQVDLVYSPFADIKIYPDGVDVVLVEGAIAQIARHYIHGPNIPEPMLNRVEAGMRAFDSI